jgi:hypothetical protein
VQFYLKTGGAFMKLIDEKGKLFGKVSVIDLFVLVVILLVVGVVAYKYVGKSVGDYLGTSSTAKNVTFTLRCTMKNEDMAKNIKVGEKLIASNQIRDAVIDSINIVPTAVTYPDSEGRAVASNDPIKKDALITVKMVDEEDGLTVKLGVQDILKGNSFTLKTDSSVFVGTIEDVQISLPAPK